MLKADTQTVFIVILLMLGEWTSVISYALPIIAGLCIYTGQQLKNKTLTARGFLIKMLFVTGLCPMVYFVYNAFRISFDISLTLFLVTFLSDALVTQGYKAGEMG